MKHIFKSFNFGTIDYKDAEKLLNNMAAKGYEFKGTGKGWIRNVAMFEENEKAKNLKYAIDVSKRKEYEKEKYYQFYRDLGWKKIDCLNKRLYIFATERENAVPLYTDELSERNMRKKAALNNGELLDHILQLVCMVIMLNVLTLGIDEVHGLIFYSFIIFYYLIVAYYALQVAAKLLYIVKGWKREKEYLVSKTLQIIRNCSKFLWIGFFIFFPAASIVEFYYGAWTKNSISTNFFGIGQEIVQFLLCIGSIPVILVGTYFLFLYPEKEKFKVLSNIGFTMYFGGLWCFLYFMF